MLAISTGKSVVHMVDTETWKSHDLVVPYSRRLQYNNSSAMSPDGRFVYSAGTSRDMWHRLETESGLVCGGVTTHDGTGGCTCRAGGDGFSDVVNKESPVEYGVMPSRNPQCALRNDYVCAMALSPDGKFLATTGEKHFDCSSTDIIIWNTETSAIEHVLRDTGHTTCLVFSSDRSRIAAGKVCEYQTAGAEVKVWDVETRELTHTLCWEYLKEINDLAFSSVNPAILAISSERSIRQVDLDNMQAPPRRFNGRNCRYSPIGDVIATSGMHSPDTHDINILSVLSGERIQGKYLAHYSPVNDICWSPYGRKIASSCHGCCKVWDPLTFRLLNTIDTSYRLGNFICMSWGPNWKRVVDRRVACAMALHDRIGNRSFMKLIPSDMLQTIAWGAEHE